MSLDPTARRANFKDSLKKFFVEQLETGKGVELMFDKSLSTPDLISKTVNRWVNIDIGDIDRSYMSEIHIDIYCCTRKDPEGFRLAQLTDTVMELLTDATTTDGMKRIPFYRSHPTDAWTLLGAFLVSEIIESRELESVDETKYIIMSCLLRTASKI